MAQDADARDDHGFLQLAKETAKEFAEDKSPRQAAAMAYYGLLAMGPLLLILISVASLLLGDAAAQRIVGPLSQVVGEDAAQAVSTLVAARDASGSSVWAAIGGGLLVLVAAGAFFAQVKETLNTAWEVAPKPVDGWKAKVWRAVRKNLVAFLAMLVVGALIVASVVASAVLAALTRQVGTVLPGGAILWQVANALLSLGVFTVAFALLFKLVPDVRIRWRDTWIGAATTAVLFLVGQYAMGWYFGSGALANRYGAAAAVVILLTWVYYSAIIFLFGAEFTQVYANRRGGNVRPDEDAQTLQRAVREKHDLPSEEGTSRGGARKRDRRRPAP